LTGINHAEGHPRYKDNAFSKSSDRREVNGMRSKIVTSLALIGWQVAAAILEITGHLHAILAAWPEPAWLAIVLAVLLTPSRWVVAAALALAVGLIVWSLYDRHRHRQSQ
jgi:hypothetical protein